MKVVHKNKHQHNHDKKKEIKEVPQWVIDVHAALVSMTGLFRMHWNPQHWDALIRELRRAGYGFGFNAENRRWEISILES